MPNSRAAFAPFAPVFSFDGEGPRAYQDFEDFATEPTAVEALLIEAPGAATVTKNAALLVKPGRVEVLSRRAAAIALLTLQTMAPAGGAGHRTSVRGGGPLTTLVMPKRPATLWHGLWANVPSGEEPPTAAQLPRIFPWLAPTRLSTKDGRKTTPEDVDWRQAFFGMPRRIRLNFEPNVERLPCDLTGRIDEAIVRAYRTRPHGTNYEVWGNIHPLTPHYRRPNDPAFYPVHGQKGRIGYRQWVAMLYGTKNRLSVPAACVSLFVSKRKDDLPRSDRSFRLMAAGYTMDNMKALAFMEAETPDITVPEGGIDAVAEKARDFVAAANVVAGALGQAVKISLYGEDADKRIQRLNDTTPLTTARDCFWSDTNDSFLKRLTPFPCCLRRSWKGKSGRGSGTTGAPCWSTPRLLSSTILPRCRTRSRPMSSVWWMGAGFSCARCWATARAASSFSRTFNSPCPKPRSGRAKPHDHKTWQSATAMGPDRPSLVGCASGQAGRWHAEPWQRSGRARTAAPRGDAD